MFSLDRRAAAPLRRCVSPFSKPAVIRWLHAPRPLPSFSSPRAPRLRETIPSHASRNRAVGRISKAQTRSSRNGAAGAEETEQTKLDWIGLDSLRLCALCAFARVLLFDPIPAFPHSPFPIPSPPAFVTQPRLFPFRRPEMCLFARRQGKISAPQLASTRHDEAHTYI